MLSSLSCFCAFADLLSLHVVTFLMFFIFVHVLFIAADACLSWSLPYITEQQVSPPQASYAVLAEESQAFFKCSPHTNSISNSAILRNNYILLLSDLCACIHMKKQWRRKGRNSSSAEEVGHNIRHKLLILTCDKWTLLKVVEYLYSKSIQKVNIVLGLGYRKLQR